MDSSLATLPLRVASRRAYRAPDRQKRALVYFPLESSCVVRSASASVFRSSLLLLSVALVAASTFRDAGFGKCKCQREKVSRDPFPSTAFVLRWSARSSSSQARPVSPRSRSISPHSPDLLQFLHFAPTDEYAEGGIGYSTVVAFAEAGCTVYATARNLTSLADLPASIHQIKVDVTSKDDCERAIAFVLEKEGKIDILVSSKNPFVELFDVKLRLAEVELRAGEQCRWRSCWTGMRIRYRGCESLFRHQLVRPDAIDSTRRTVNGQTTIRTHHQHRIRRRQVRPNHRRFAVVDSSLQGWYRLLGLESTLRRKLRLVLGPRRLGWSARAWECR